MPPTPRPDLPPIPGFGPPPPVREVTPPLGLPLGSVRALLALILTATLWYLILRERLVPVYLADTAFLAVTFYFGARTSDEEKRSEAPRRQPLFLPKGFVRGLIVAGTFGVYGYLWYSGGEIPEALRVLFELFIGYTAGVVVSGVVRAGSRAAQPGVLAAFGHARATLCLVGVSFLCIAAVFGADAVVPPIYLTVLQFLVSFYFGSRSVR